MYSYEQVQSVGAPGCAMAPPFSSVETQYSPIVPLPSPTRSKEPELAFDLSTLVKTISEEPPSPSPLPTSEVSPALAASSRSALLVQPDAAKSSSKGTPMLIETPRFSKNPPLYPWLMLQGPCRV